MQKVLLLFVVSMIHTNPALSQEGAGGLFNFFSGRDIDYWREGKTVNPAKTFSPQSADNKLDSKSSNYKSGGGSNVIREADSKPFSWKPYEDPKNPEFWDDGGDWIPPRPFREAAANPTDENIAAYLKWIARKGMLVTKLQEKLSGESAPVNAQQDTPQSDDWRGVEVAYFYQTACPHCQSSKQTIETVEKLGGKVTYIQLDSKTNPPLHDGSIPYSKDWASHFEVSVTPTWYLKYRHNTTQATGALSIQALSQIINTLKTGAN